MATKVKKVKTKKFDYKTIKTFEDACNKAGVDPTALPDVSSIPEEFRKALIAGYKLLIIYKAINNGWKSDWNNWQQNKYYPWFAVLSSGFGLSYSYFVLRLHEYGCRFAPLHRHIGESALYSQTIRDYIPGIFSVH